MTLTQALLKIPVNFYLQISNEKEDVEGNAAILGASLMEKPPEGGWPSLDARFGSTGYANDPKRLELLRYDDAARCGISVCADDPSAFEKLLVDMILSRWP